MDRRLGGRRPTAWRMACAWALAALCAALLTGCAGGSGSSGFDIVAAENGAIDNAIGSGGCVVERGLTICAAAEGATPPPSPTPTHTLLPSPTGTPAPIRSESATPLQRTATPTGTPFSLPSATRTGTRIAGSPTATRGPSQPSVDIQVDGTDVATCAASADSQPCAVRVMFVPVEAPAGAAYRFAVRARNPDTAWRVRVADGAVIEIVVPPGVTAIQTAILLYERDPGPVPPEIQVLSDSGADFAFVAAPLVVRSAAAR